MPITARRRHEHRNNSDGRTAEALIAGKMDTQGKPLTEFYDVIWIVRQLIVKERKSIVRLSLTVKYRDAFLSSVKNSISGDGARQNWDNLHDAGRRCLRPTSKRDTKGKRERGRRPSCAVSLGVLF